MTDDTHRSTRPLVHRDSLWKIAWLVVAAIYAAPVCYVAYDRVIEVTQRARERLIIQHRLWEVDKDYQGSPRTWTRVALHVLSDNQLMRRVRVRYGDLANEIELDYRRDLTIAQGEVVFLAVAAWAIPVAVMYGIGLIVARRRRPSREPPKPPETTTASDSRYRP